MAQTSSRGFASMDREKQKEIARKGGRAAHAKGTAHEFTPDEARAAGRKGGEVVSRNRQHMAEIGRRGGERRGARRAAARNDSTDQQLQQPRVEENGRTTEARPAQPRPFADRVERSYEVSRESERR